MSQQPRTRRTSRPPVRPPLDGPAKCAAPFPWPCVPRADTRTCACDIAQQFLCVSPWPVRCATQCSIPLPPFPPPLFERGCMARLTSDFRGSSSSARTKVTGCTQHTKRSPQWYSRLHSPEHVCTRALLTALSPSRIFLVSFSSSRTRPTQGPETDVTRDLPTPTST